RVLAKRQKILAPLKSGLAEAEHGREKATQAWRVPVLQFLVSWVSEGRSGEAAKQVKPDEQHQYEELKARVTQLDVRKRLGRWLGVKENPAKVPLTQVLRQGDYRKPADEVQPGIPSLFDPANVTIASRAKTTGRRTALADWIASPRNPWTARVMVNRIW